MFLSRFEVQYLLRSYYLNPFPSSLCPNVRLGILFSNTPSLHSSLYIKYHVSTGNIIFLCVLIFKFFERLLKKWIIKRIFCFNNFLFLPNLMSIFLSHSCLKLSVYDISKQIGMFLQCGVASLTLNPQPGRLLLVRCPGLHIQYIYS